MDILSEIWKLYNISEIIQKPNFNISLKINKITKVIFTMNYFHFLIYKKMKIKFLKKLLNLIIIKLYFLYIFHKNNYNYHQYKYLNMHHKY